MAIRFQENNLNILKCMQDIFLNNTPKQVSFDEVSRIYGLDRDNLKSKTFIRTHNVVLKMKYFFNQLLIRYYWEIKK